METTQTYTKSGSGTKTQEFKARGEGPQEWTKPQPQKEHQWLQKLVGQWQFEGELTLEPGKPTEKFAGTENVRSIGDFWIIGDIQSQMHDNPQSMVVTLGYDAQKKRFVGTFIASMESHLWLYDGSLDAAQKVLTLNTEGPDMAAGGRMARFKDVMEIRSDDHRILTSHMLGEDEKWRKVVTIYYRRTE